MATVLQFQVPRSEQRKGNRLPNAQCRPREWLRKEEIEAIISSIDPQSRTAERDKLLIRFSWMHGLRLSEALNARWSDIDFKAAQFFVRRVKGSTSGTHSLTGQELRALRSWQRHQPKQSAYIFTSWNESPIAARSVQKLCKILGKRAQLPLDIHFHMLRHSCGYHLANGGVGVLHIQQWLGHTSINNTIKYTHLVPNPVLKDVTW